MCILRDALRRRLRTASSSLRVDRTRPSATVVLEGWSPPIFGSAQNPAYRSTRLHLRRRVVLVDVLKRGDDVRDCTDVTYIRTATPAEDREVR